MKLLVGGDLCPIRRNEDLFADARIDEIWGGFLPIVEEADFFVANLECPFIDRGEPISKTGPALKARSECIRGLRASGLSAVGLANNHIMDYGVAGLRNTLELCNSAGIQTFGAGLSRERASQPLILQKGGVKVAILAVAEREFSVTLPENPGANPIALPGLTDAIRELSGSVDAVVTLVHGGLGGFRLPSPRLQWLCRSLAHAGCDVVICQHSHVVGCSETFEDRFILYGQGNLLFDLSADDLDPWNTGVFTRIEVGGSRKEHRVEVLPFIQSGRRPGLSDLTPAEEEAFWCGFSERSELVSDPTRVALEWKNWVLSRERDYLGALFFPSGRLARWLRKTPLHHLVFRPERKQLLLNLLRCESHREAMEVLLSGEPGDPTVW